MKIDKIWEKAEKTSIYFILIVFSSCELLSIFIKKVDAFMENHGSLLFVSIILLFIFRYLDKNLSLAKKTGLRSVEKFTTDVVSLLNKPTYKNIIIFANSSYKYYNALSESNSNIETVILLIRDFSNPDSIQFPSTDIAKNEFANNSKQLVNNWKLLKDQGKIRNLEVYFYPFDSILHFMIIDNTTLHFGLLKPTHHYPGSSLNGSYIVDNDTEDGRTLIKSFLDEFIAIKNEFGKCFN